MEEIKDFKCEPGDGTEKAQRLATLTQGTADDLGIGGYLVDPEYVRLIEPEITERLTADSDRKYGHFLKRFKDQKKAIGTLRKDFYSAPSSECYRELAIKMRRNPVEILNAREMYIGFSENYSLMTEESREKVQLELQQRWDRKSSLAVHVIRHGSGRALSIAGGEIPNDAATRCRCCGLAPRRAFLHTSHTWENHTTLWQTQLLRWGRQGAVPCP